jgi:hypothetical protein
MRIRSLTSVAALTSALSAVLILACDDRPLVDRGAAGAGGTGGSGAGGGGAAGGGDGGAVGGAGGAGQGGA